MADKPGHMIEIPDSLGRDIDRAREGKLKEPIPVEAFMSDAALQQVADQTKAAEPVHAERLQPISAAEAARRRTLGGDSLPDFPQTRRVVPAPFQRPRISAGQHGKTWQYVTAREVVEGDLVPDIGVVASAVDTVVYQLRWQLGLPPKWDRCTACGSLSLGKPHDEEHAGYECRDCGEYWADEKVAVGIAVVITGQGGNVKAFRENGEVRVFRTAPGA